MAGIVEEMIADSIEALVNRDPALAETVISQHEDHVNRLEIENQDTAINLIALHQPEAKDLRTIAMAVMINDVLERLGDHAVNIAQAAQYLIPRPPVKPLVHIPQMADQAVAMLKDSLDAFTRTDPELARSVCARDNAVDELNLSVRSELIATMVADSGTIERALKLILIALNLERIADLATNIAEDVIYMTTGEVIKHGRGAAPSTDPAAPPSSDH